MRARVTVVGALVAALAAGLALLPARGVGTDPRICWAWRGYEVPCAKWPSWIVVAGIGALAGAVVWRLTRSKSTKDHTRELVR